MPFVDKSTLTYPATNSFPVRKWLDQTRAPTSSDYKNFNIFDIWIWEGNSAWIMIDKTAAAGEWVQMSSSGTGILTITGDAGGAISADGANNINLLTGDHLTTTGDAPTNTITISLDATIAEQFDTDSGSATPSSGVLEILGAGGISTSGATNVVTVTAGATIPTSFVTDAGTAVPALQALNILGGVGCSTSGAGSTVTINVAGHGLNWSVIGANQTLAVNNGYICGSGAALSLALPATSSVGDLIEVVLDGSTSWTITQGANQQIRIGNVTSTLGAGGSVSSTAQGDAISIVCRTADTLWVGVPSPIGSLNIV